MATIQKRGISLLLVLILVLGMVPSVSAAEIETQPSTEPAETTTPVTEETLEVETSPPETTQPEETSPPETTEPEQTVPTEPVPEETELEEETEPVEESPSEETEENPAADEELSLALMSLDDGIASIAETEIVGAPNAFGYLFLINGGIDIPSFDHMQHKEHLPLYSVYLKNQPGYENNYYVAYCIEPGVVLGESGGHNGSSTTVGGMTDGTGALERLSREQVEAMGVVLMYGQREIARRADAESIRLQKLRRHAATQAIIWEIACGWRSATPPYARNNSTLYDAITPSLEISVGVWNSKFYLDGIDEAYDEIAAQLEQHGTIPSFMTRSKSNAPSYELIADGNGRYSITLADSNNVLSQYSFTNTSDLTFSVSGNKLTITANGPISDTLVAPTKQAPSLDSQVFYVWEYKEQQKLMSCKTEPVVSPIPAYFYVTVPDLTASLNLTKTTEDGKNLSGWKFGIYSDSGCSNLISGPHTTDANGKISVDNLTAGTVYVKELGHTDSTINALYSCSSTNPQKVVLTAGETAKVSFHNKLNTGDVKLVKQTNTGKNLVGWLIGLYYDSACTKPVSGSPFTTGTNGTITVSGLKPGTLYAKEIPTDDPYWEFDTDVKEVKIVANQTATVSFTNTHFGRIKFQKTTNTGNHLGGWTFRVTDANGNHVGDYTTDENGEAYLFSPVYNTEFQYESQNASRVSIILINREAIHDLFRASQTNSEESILLLNSDKQLLTYLSSNVSTDTIQQICDYIRSSTDTAEILRLTVNGVENIIFISQSAQTGLYYVRFLPEYVAYQPIYQMRNISFAILAAVLVLSVFLVGYGMKRSYVPIRTLADWIQTKQPTNLNARNELLLFKKVFDETFEQNSNMSELISNSKYGLIDHFLKDLICGNFSSESEFTAACRKLNIAFTKKYYAVACVLVESNSEEDSNIDFNLILDTIRDELPENISIQIKDLLFAGKLIIVLNSDSDDLSTYKKVIVTIKQRLLDHADILTSIGMGSFYGSYEHVGKSYLEAINALDYRLIYGKDCLITQEMCNIDKTELVYPTEDISQLASALLSKDAEAASEAIYRLNAYAKSPHCTLHSAKYICYDTFSVLKKMPPFMNVGYENTGSDNLDITKLTDYDNIDEFFTALQRIVQNAIGTPRSVASESDLGPQLVEYIEQHCFSYNFQISTIAEHFSISQPSMRKIFREYTGIGISDYVTNIKVEKAMQLLRETDTNVQEIVTEIGNTDASAFIRLFKKKTGMTPGQYRKANRF